MSKPRPRGSRWGYRPRLHRLPLGPPARRGYAALTTAALGAAVLLAGSSCAPIPPPGTSPAPPTTGRAPAPKTPGAPGTPGQTTAPRPVPNVEPDLDIGLAWDLDSLAVSAATKLSLHVASARGDLPLGGSPGAVAVRRHGDAWEIESRESGPSSNSTALAAADTLWIGGAGADARASRLRWAGKTWRGAGKVFIGPRGKLTFALRLPLETYLLGVVPGEIGGLNPGLLQAGRAQAIAARSYTLFYRGRRGTEGFDLYGTVEDQVYGPVDTERDLATQCVTGTRGSVALYRGLPIRANYCSTCGGITADVWEAWPTAALDYLVSHRDESPSGDFCASSPQYRWREVWSAAEFVSDVTRYAPLQGVALPPGGIGDLVDVAAERRSRSGRVWQLRVRGTTGDVLIPAYSIRQVLRRGGNPTAILRSNLFKIDVLRDRPTRRAASVIASGGGSGHGVGLCQTGALGMARTGKSAEAILQHYYPGIDLKRIY